MSASIIKPEPPRLAAIVTGRNGKKKLVDELTPDQAKGYLGVSRSTIYRLLDAGVFECRRPTPGKILISLASLKKYKEAPR